MDVTYISRMSRVLPNGSVETEKDDTTRAVPICSTPSPGDSVKIRTRGGGTVRTAFTLFTLATRARSKSLSHIAEEQSCGRKECEWNGSPVDTTAKRGPGQSSLSTIQGVASKSTLSPKSRTYGSSLQFGKETGTTAPTPLTAASPANGRQEAFVACGNQNQEPRSFKTGYHSLSHRSQTAGASSFQKTDHSIVFRPQPKVRGPKLQAGDFNLEKTPIGEPSLARRQKRAEVLHKWEAISNTIMRLNMERNLDKLAEEFGNNSKGWCDMVAEQERARAQLWKEAIEADNKLNTVNSELTRLTMYQPQPAINPRQRDRVRIDDAQARAHLVQLRSQSRVTEPGFKNRLNEIEHRIRVEEQQRELRMSALRKIGKKLVEEHFDRGQILMCMAQDAARSVGRLMEWDADPGTAHKRMVQRQQEREKKARSKPLLNNPVAQLQPRKSKSFGLAPAVPAWQQTQPQEDYFLWNINHRNHDFTRKALEVPRWFVDLDAAGVVRLKMNSPQERYEELWNLVAQFQSDMDQEKTQTDAVTDEFAAKKKSRARQWHSPHPGWSTDDRMKHGGWWLCRTGDDAPEAERRCSKCRAAAAAEGAGGIPDDNRSAKEKYDELMGLVQNAMAKASDSDVGPA